MGRTINETETSFLNEEKAKTLEFKAYITDCGGAVLKVNTGGNFVIGNEATSTAQKGIVYMKPKSQINVSGGTVKLVKGSELIIEPYASVSLNSGVIELNDNSQIIVENKGQAFISGGTLNLKGSSKLIVKSGGTLTVNPAAITNMNDYAQIIVETGGKLIIENGKGAEIVFSGNGTDNPIKVYGEVVINAPIRMSGSAYFDVYPVHKFTLNVPFQLSGDNHEMLRLRENTYFRIVGQDVTFNTGIVNYLEKNTRIVLPAKKDAVFNTIRFTGNSIGSSPNTNFSSNVVGLANNGKVSPNSLNIDACYFNHLDVCISLDNENYSDAPQTLNIVNSTFTDYRTCGVYIKTAEIFRALYSHFKTTIPTKKTSKELAEFPESKYPPAIVLKDFYQQKFWIGKPKVVIDGGTIQGNEYDVVQKWYDSNFSQNSTSLITKDFDNNYIIEDNYLKDNYSFAVYLEDVPTFVMQNNQVISNAFNGILARGNTNIDMFSGSRFYNNGIGVNLIGQLTDDLKGTKASGRFSMDCSSLNRNVFGVLGRNVVLSIDEFLNSNNANFNTFIQYTSNSSKVTGKYFDYFFNYTLTTPSIPATYNKWYSKLPIQDVDYFIGKPNSGKFFSTALDLGTIIPSKAKDCDNLPAKIYDDKDLANVDDNNAKGMMSISGVYQPALPIFWSGLSNFYNENEDAAITNFAKLASVSEDMRNEMESTYGKLMIDVAKTMTYIRPDANAPTLSRVQKTRAVIYPNPTDNFFNINLEKGSYAVSIVDMQGRVVYQQNTEGNLEVETEKWLSGIYQVFITNENTGTEMTEKVVVMRY